jgi:hypothetical protein
MRLSLMLIVSAFAASPGFGQGMPGYDTNTHCRRLAGDSYSLEKTCRDVEEHARDAVRHADVPSDIWRHCTRVVGRSSSYSLLQTCIGVEESAKASLGPTRSDQPYDPGEERRKTRLRTENGYHDPVSVDLCPPPHRMTRDGCQ